MALCQVLCLFCLIPAGFQNATLRQWMANLLGLDVDDYIPGKMTYDLRRLRLHGVIVRIPHTHRYQVTDAGLKVCLFFTKVHARVFRSGLTQIADGLPERANRPITAAMNHLDKGIKQHIQAAKLNS